MKYFFSFVPLALKINGEYKGIIHTEPKGEILKPNDFIELICPSSEFLPISFCLKSPPEQIKILTSRFGSFIFPLALKPYPLGYEKLYFYEFGTTTISVVCDGVTKIIVEDKNLLLVETLHSKPRSCQVLFSENGYIGLLFELNKPTLLVFNLTKGKTELYTWADKIYLENECLITKTFSPTMLRHSVITTYSLNDFNKSIKRTLSLEKLNLEQKKYAFLECLVLGDNIDDFLASGLNATALKEFIGEFETIMPSLSPNHDFSLIGKKLKFIKFKMQDGLITDIDLD